MYFRAKNPNVSVWHQIIKFQIFLWKDKNKRAMVYFLNSKVKTHTEDALQYIFDENKEKIVILGYSIVSRRSPLQPQDIFKHCWKPSLSYWPPPPGGRGFSWGLSLLGPQEPGPDGRQPVLSFLHQFLFCKGIFDLLVWKVGIQSKTWSGLAVKYWESGTIAMAGLG